jgi:aryl-phospho-beta-D-glucosidase BglC (GH1 family)
MKRALGLILFSVLILVMGSSGDVRAAGVPESRLERLSRGVSITRWFWLDDSGNSEHFAGYINDAQLAEIRATGFQHVRLVIEPRLLLNESSPEQLDPRVLGHLRTAIDRLLNQDLAVIVDVHAWEAWLNNERLTDPDLQVAYASMWGALARELSTTDPEMVYLEVMNEPAPDDPSIWQPILERFVQAIRTSAPEHTIIVGGAYWNSIDGLLLLTSLADTNLVYNFHFYEPMVFTHQGAGWLEPFDELANVPYPSAGRCSEVRPTTSEWLNAEINTYCAEEPWHGERIAARIREAADWAVRYGVPLTANEFGVYPATSNPEDRLDWIREVRRALEKSGIGWTVWGYDDIFGLGYLPEAPGMDIRTLAALGMVLPSGEQSNTVPDARYARLTQGVALTRWFTYSPEATPAHWESYTTDDRLRELREAGFNHVRLPIAPEELFDPNDPATPEGEQISYIRTAIERLVAADLAVLVDVHPWSFEWQRQLEDAVFVQQFGQFWQSLATILADTDPEMVFLEVLNEPRVENWWAIQEELIGIIRSAAPNHTIIVGANDWNSPLVLSTMTPYTEPNLIYNFHFYSPFLFTHQGAAFNEFVAPFYGLPYPSTEGRCGELPDFWSEDRNWAAQDYCGDNGYDRTAMQVEILPAISWARRHGLRLMSNEFGVLDLVAPSPDREQWFYDLRTLLETHEIGWTVWDLEGGFGLGYNDEQPYMNPGVLEALGLERPQRDFWWE